MGLKYKGKIILVGLILILLLLAIFAQASDRTYQGKLIDAETKEPIEGAVVVAVWWEQRGFFFGSTERLKDVKEALTDQEGKWSIVGPEGYERKLIPGLLQLIGIWATKSPSFIIFKPGYCSWPDGFSIDACKEKIKPEGMIQIMEGKTIELPKLTRREDRLRSCCPSTASSSSDDPREYRRIKKKQLEFLRLINEERRNLGLSEYKLYEELKNEK
jgi:hypothetical protein